jgi:hypothetical protein
MNFASIIGKFYSEQKLPEDEVIEESSISSSNEDANVMEKEVAEANDIAVPAKLFQCIDLPQQDFPLLHSLDIQKQYQFNKAVYSLSHIPVGVVMILLCKLEICIVIYV